MGRCHEDKKDEAPGQSEEYSTVANPTRTMVDGKLPENAVKYFQE